MKRGKMQIRLLIAAVLALGGCLFAASCGEGGHVHSFGEWQVTEATCTTDGVRTRVCSCGEEEKEVLPKLGHDYGNGVVKTSPTCTETGMRERTCSRCQDVLQEEIPAKGHDWEDVEVLEEATCTEKGEVLRRCAVCSTEQEFDTEAKGHTWNVLRTLEPGCETAGAETRTCKECGETEEAEVPALGHRWTTTRVLQEATCTTSGSREQTCDRCKTTQQVEVPALGHNFEGTYTVDKRPSFEAAGEKSYHCTRCNERNGVTVIPMLEENTPIDYEFRIRRNNGALIVNKLMTVTVKDGEGNTVATSTPANVAGGIFTLSLLPKTYTVTLSNLPEGFSAETYTVEAEEPYCNIWLTAAPIAKTIPSGKRYTVGDVMYDFSYRTLNGKDVTLRSLLEGKKGLMLNFFYATCTYCNQEFPGLNRAYLKYQDDISVLAIDPRSVYHDSEDTVKGLVTTYSLAFDVAIDDTLNLHNNFSVVGYPTSVFIDAEGVITYIQRGAVVESGGEDASETYFSGKFAELCAEDYWKNPQKTSSTQVALSEPALPVRSKELDA